MGVGACGTVGGRLREFIGERFGEYYRLWEHFSEYYGTVGGHGNLDISGLGCVPENIVGGTSL